MDWFGGGGKAGDIGTCGEFLAELSASGEAVKVSTMGEAIEARTELSGVPGEYGGGGDGIAAVTKSSQLRLAGIGDAQIA